MQHFSVPLYNIRFYYVIYNVRPLATNKDKPTDFFSFFFFNPFFVTRVPIPYVTMRQEKKSAEWASVPAAAERTRFFFFGK